MVILGQVPAESSTVLLFAIGMGIALVLIYGLAVWNKSSEGDKSTAVSNSREGYKCLEETVRESWSKVSRNHRLYLGALIIGFGVQKFWQIAGHPIFGSSIVISFTYLVVFTSSFKHLVNRRALDHKVIACSLKGMQMEKEHPEWSADFFRRFVNENYQGYGIFSLVFFRVIILAWLLFSVIDFGILSRFSDAWPILRIWAVSIAIFFLSFLFLWRIGCHPYYSLGTRSKEVPA